MDRHYEAAIGGRKLPAETPVWRQLLQSTAGVLRIWTRTMKKTWIWETSEEERAQKGAGSQEKEEERVQVLQVW